MFSKLNFYQHQSVPRALKIGRAISLIDFLKNNTLIKQKGFEATTLT
jgi:hypothetical protein